MGDYAGATRARCRGRPTEIADHLAALAGAGAAHVQLVVDPITSSRSSRSATSSAELD